jgi:hypothetical protein
VDESHHRLDVMWPGLDTGEYRRVLTQYDEDGYIYYYGTAH